MRRTDRSDRHLRGPAAGGQHAPAPAASAKVEAIDFDLARVKPSDPADACDGRSQGSDIVICGRRKPPALPLDAMANIYEPKPLRAQLGLGGGATADVEQVGLPNGAVSKRLMVRIKMPF